VNMRKGLRAIALRMVILVSALAVACACSPASGTSQEVNLGSGDNGREIDVQKGQVVVISLPANPSTGYSWEREGDQDEILQQLGDTEFKSQSNLVGASGVQILRYEAKQAGETTLKLVYHRPWEKGVEPEETFSVQIVVK
jgi:inhibitor of cysteine peptidase